MNYSDHIYTAYHDFCLYASVSVPADPPNQNSVLQCLFCDYVTKIHCWSVSYVVYTVLHYRELIKR